MTSTNDGKEVKSNQTSGQKGKSYYIELYKSLETRLVEPGSGSQRTRAVCEAWRRVHSLCQHSAPSTHSHFHSWIQQHTSQTILQTDWRQSDNKEEQHAWLQEAIDAFIAECNEAISTRNGVAADWENLLLERAQWFRTILKDPWGHPVLKALVNSQGDELTDQEVLEWLKEEKDITFVTRLRQLAASRSCMDLALRLATAVMDRARVTDGVTGVEQTDKPTRSETNTKSQFVTILENEAGFTTKVWDFVKDIEFVLLYSESRSRCIDLAKQQPHLNAHNLVERLRNRLELSPRDKKVWKNAKEVATLIAQVVIARCMVVPICTGDTRVALYRCARTLVRLLPADKLPTAAAALAAPAATARHLHTLALAVHTECKTERKSFVCELYVRAITAGMNELERLKIKTDKESEARSVEKMLSIWFTQLGSLLSASARMNCECILTAFSVHPTPLMYEQVKIAPPLEPLHKDVQEPKPETNSEFGSWATDSRTQTNLVKTSETLNLKSQKQTNVLSTAMFTEGEALGLEAELCQDLAVLISGPRVKTLSWDMDRELLLENCRTYMERTHGGTRALTTELKYLNLDPRSFQHLPEEDDDENDVYYGIEKGYEHLLETPEEIWQNALSDNSEKIDTVLNPHSTEECAIDIPKQKKKSKRSQHIEEVDPLSMIEETNRTELQERSHSKERSKERRRKKHNIKEEYSQEKTKDIHKKEKKKERKERKKKEKYETIKDTIMQNPKGNLSNLVGLKVCRVPDDKCITDSDYDSQGKSSINSECNNPIITEDNFSINDMKRSMYQYNELCSSREVLSKEKTYKVPDKQKSQSLAKNNAHGIFSSYNPERHVSEEVKKSIKQFVEMKQNNKFTVEPIFRQHENNYNSLNAAKTFPPASVNDNYNYIKGGLQTPNLQPKGNLIMHRERQLNSLKDEVNSVLRNFNDQDNSIKQKFSNVTVETFIPSCLSNERNKFKVDGSKSVQFGVNSSTVVKHPVQNYKLQTPLNHLLPNTAKSSLMKKNESPSQCQFKEFLKQRSVSPTITKPPIRSTFDTPSQMQFQEFLRQQNSFQPTSALNNTKDIIQKNSQDQSMPITATHKKLHTSNNKEKMKIEDSNKQHSSVNLQNISHQVSSNITDSGNQNQYQKFLKELMEATNAGAVNDRAEINQPGFDKDSFNQLRKADNALNTFSRLSYLHKNKQNDNKHRLSLDRSSHPQNMSMEELRTLDINYSKNSNRQSKGEVATLNMDKTIPINENKKIGANSTIINQYPIVSNMLSSGFRYRGPDIVQKDINNVVNKNVSVGTSNLSEHDHNDLLLLLHQKSKMNPQSNNDNITGSNPKTDISVMSKINDLSQSSHNLNLDLSRPEISRTDKPIIKTSSSNTSSTTSELKKVRTVKASSKNIKQQISKENDVSNSDWESVMNALLSHKTPSRGPNALDIVLKKDSFEKRIANKPTENPKAVNSSHARINTVTECGGSKISLTKKDYTHDVKQLQDKKITKVDMNMRVNRKITPKMKDKQFSSFIQNGTDPFISGIPHSDFDLLGELMDDDLRKEIGELLDDDEVYGLGMSTPKTNSVMHNKSKPATSHKPQIIIDTRPNLNSENLTTKLDESLQSKSNGVFKTIIHGKSTAILTSTNISNQPQLICDPLSPEVTFQKSNCKISSDAQANQCAKTITSIAEKNRSRLTANKSNSGNEMIEVKMPQLQTCNLNILESPKVVLAVPQPVAPNVVLISNELVYKPLTLEVKQPEPQTQSQFSVNNYVKVNQLSSSYLAINQSSGSYVTVTQPSGYVANSRPSGSYIAVTQPSASYMAVTQPSCSYVEVHQTSLVTPHYPVVIDTGITIPVIQRLPQDIPLVNNSPVDILVSEKRAKLKCTKFQLEETNLKTKEINISAESKIKSYSNNDINISRLTPNESLVRLNPRISEENATVSSKVTEPPVSVPAQVHKPRVSTETIKKYSESLREFLTISSVEKNQAVPENSFTISSKVIETTITAPVPLALTPTVSLHKPRVSTEIIQKDSVSSRDILDSSSVKVNPKLPEKNVILPSNVIERTTVTVPLVLTPTASKNKPIISTELLRKDSEPSQDFLDSSSVEANTKIPEKNVTLPSNVIEPTTVAVPLVLTPTASINKPIVSTELLRKDSESSRDFQDSSSVGVNPKIPENNVTLPSNVIEPTTVTVPLVLTPTASINKPIVSTELLRKDSEPSQDFLDSSSVEVNPKIPEKIVTLPSNVNESTTVTVPLVLTPTASINKPIVSTELLRKDSEPSQDFLDSSSVEVNPKIPEKIVTLPSNVNEPTTVTVPLVLTPTPSINKRIISTELLRKDSESSRDFLDSSSVEVNPKIPEKNVTLPSNVIEPTTVTVPLVCTPTASINKPIISTELLQKDLEPSQDFLDSSSVEANPKIPEKNVTLPSNVIEPTTVAVPLVLTPTASVNKPIVSTELLRKDSEPSQDFLDSSSVEVNPKIPEKNVTLPSNVIEPTTVTVPLVRTSTASINKPIISTELLRKDSESSRDFLDSSSVEVIPKIPEENVTISSTVKPPVAVSKPKFSVSKLRVRTVTVLEDSEPSDNVTLIDRLNQSDCVKNIFPSNNKIAKSNESNEKINKEDRDFKFDKRFEDEAKITITDHERIKLKRILLKNRLNHHNYCRNEPIVLTYEPLQIRNEALVSNLKSGDLSESEPKKDSKNEKNTITDLLRTNKYKNIIENTSLEMSKKAPNRTNEYKNIIEKSSPEMSNKAPNRTNEYKYIENTSPEMSNKAPNKNINMTTLSELPSRRILLRSLNSLETAIPVTIKPKSLQKNVCKDKLKRKKLKKYKVVLNNDLINNEIEQNTLKKVEDKSGMSSLPEVDLEDQITPSVIKIPNKIHNIEIVDNGGLSKQKKIILKSQVTETTGGYAHNSNILHGNNPNSNSKSNTFKNKTSQKVDPRFNNSKDKIEDKNYKNPNSYKANNGKTAHRAKDYPHVTNNNITSTNSGNLTKSAEESKNKNVSEYKDKIIFEELPNVNNDPFKKFVRIKLPGGKTFKATISGKLNINIDSLFEEPSIKAMILKNINNNEKCTLNVKQVVLKNSKSSCTTQAENRSTTSFTNSACDLSSRPKNIAPRTVITQVRDLSTSGIDEIIDLISDDEENPTQIFKTEFGNFNSASMNEDVFLKHQRKLSQKCEVKVCRCDFVQEMLKLKLTKEVISIIEKPLPLENITDIIEIDDSSNDSEKNAEKFDSTSLNVKNDVQITKPTENVDVLKDMLLNDLGVKDNPEKSNMNKSNVQTQNHVDRNLSFINAETHKVKSKICVLKLDKCDELMKKMEIQKNICFVRLVRCDSLVRNTCHFNELSNFESQSAEKIQTEDDTKMESFKEKHMLRRSGSLSILNDFSVIEEVKSDRSSPSLIENLETPLILPNNNIKTSLHNSFTTYNCNAEWFMSKSYLLNLHKETFINANNLDCFGENEKSQIDDKSTDCDSDIENNLLADDSLVIEEKSYKERELYQVLSLVKIIINFFANNDSIIEKLKSGQEGTKTVLYSSPLKRKYEEAVDKHRQKISKQENCHSCVASKSKKENLCQELLNHKLNVNEEQCFESVSDVKKYDENDIQALNINNLTQNKLSNIENEQENNLLDSRKNKIGLDCHIAKNKHVDLDEKILTKQVQQIKYTTQHKKLNLKENIGKINDINSSYDRTVEIKESVNVIKNDVYDDVHQHIPVTKTKIEKLSNDRLIDFNRKTLKKCVVNIEKCCTEQLSLSEQKSSISKVDDKLCALRLASDMETTNMSTIEVSTVPSLIVTGLTELEKIGSSKIDHNIDDTMIIKSKTDVKPSGHEEVRGHSDTNLLNGISDLTVKSKLQDNLRNVNQCMLRITQGYSNKPEDEDLEFYAKIPTKESVEHKTYNSLQKTVEEQEKCNSELDLGPENDLVEVIIPLNEEESTDIGALFSDSDSDADKECKYRTSNINGKHYLQNIESEKLDGKAVLESQINQEVHKSTNQCKNDEDTHIVEDSSKNKIANLNVTSNKHKASNEVKVTLNYNEDTKCNVTLGTNRSLLAFPRIESKGSVEKSFEVRNKGSTDNTLQENITLVYNGDSLKGSIYENPIVGKCYLFCDNVCNDNSVNVIQALKSKIFEDRHKDEKSGNTETKNTKYDVIIPNFTYSRQRVKNDNISNNHNSIEDRRKNLKRKIDSCDNKLNKKYRKGKNIDYPKPTFASMSNTSYEKEYKRLFDYWSSIKFSFTRPFHQEYIDVSGKLKSWPITEMHMDVSDLEEKETFLYLDNKLKEKGSSDPMKQTLAEEILSGYIEPQSSCDEINENNFSMGFGERSDRVIQNSGDGDNISKFSAATLSDVKQSQPFLVSEDNKKNDRCEFYKSKIEQMEINKRYFSFIQLRDKVQSVFKKTTLDLHSSWLEENFKNKSRALEYSGKNNDLFPYDLLNPDFIEPAPIETTVHVVQVGQLPVSAAAQNPVTCDPRVTQVTDASPSQCSAENSPHEDLQSPIKTEYTELTTADISLPSVQEHEYHNESQVSVVPTNNENISIKIEISSEDLNNASEELSQPQEEESKCKTEPDDLESLVNKHINNIEYSFEPNDNNTLEGQTNPEIKCESPEQNNSGLISQQKQNGSSEKTDQIAHAMNAAGITTSPEPIIPENTTTQTLVNMFSQKICQEVPCSTSQNNFAKASINTMTLQQALAQILPPPLNQTNSQESNQVISNSSVASQVLHIVQGKNTNGSQITVVDNTQNSVISNSGTPVLHIVHNKGVNSTPSSTNLHHGNTYSGLSLVDAGIQQGNNQLLHIVNAGTQKNNATGQLLKRVNLLTNVQGSNEQKMLQFVCKSGDGKSIQLNAPHQRSMVLRLQPFESPSIQSNLKTSESQDLSPSSNTNSVLSKEPNNSQHEIKSRSIYEENYAKFIQNSSNKTISEKSTSLPKFNQAFGKQVFQDGNQKPNETSTNSCHLSSDTENDCQSSENTLNLDHIGHLNSPPLLLRKSPAQTSQTHSNIVHQIKQTIAPMMHGGVIYTRQIPVNIGGGQTINLITVPSTELIDDSNQKQHGDLKFVNQGEIESPIIKIVPQNQSTDLKSEESNNHQTNTSDNVQNNVTQHQPVLTQMRIKLPMLSKTPQMVSGARVVRPSFFQIHRNVIGGANQPVYQQLVLTAAPPLGQHTIRLPHVQTRQVKIATENQSSSESQMSSSTLEQLREFDMVLEQVKERSTVQPNCTNNFSKLNKSSSDTTDCTSVTSTVTESTQQVLYSIGANQSLNVAYVNRKQNTTATPSTAFVRSPDSSGILESSSSAHAHIPHTVTSESTSNDASTQQNHPKAAKLGSKSKSRPKSSSHSSNPLKINTVPPKTSTQKPLEDEQTTQRILYILAEYKEQVENSPDKDKPAPRRRTNPPSNPGSSKRKKSSSSSRRSGARDVSPIHEDACRTMGSEDSSCGTSQGDCTESCLESHSPQDSPRKVVRKLTFENEISATSQPRTQPQRNVIVADGQTITVARGTSGKPTTAVLMPANYILPVSMVKGGQQIAIVTNRGPKLLTVGGGEGGTNALLLQRLIGPAGLKPVLARPGVRHVRLPTAALHNLQAFNLATTTTVHSQDSAASPSPAPTPPELIETRANSSPWEDRESQDVKPEPESSPEGSGPWLLTADPNDYSYEETVRTENMDRTVLVVQKKYGRQHRLTHVSAAALRHRYAMLENELRLQGSGFLQKSLSEECEDLGVDSPSASELFPEAELLFSSSPAHEAQQQSQTPQPTIHNQSGVPQPDIDDQIASDHFLEHDVHGNQEDLGVTLGLDEGIVTVTEDGMQANIAVDQEEFARSHPNTTFHSEPTEEGEVQPFTITDLKGRQITSTIFHAGRAPATVLVTAPQTTVISQATQENVENNVKYANIDHIVNAPSTHRNLNISSVVVKEDGLTKFDNILTDSREIHLSNTASTIVHSTGNATKVIRRVCYEDDKRETRYLMDESDGIIAGDDAKMIAEDSSRDATLESMADVDEGNSSPERNTELFWESNSASERSESRRPLDFSSDSEKCCKSPFEETNSTDSSGVGTHMRLDSVIKEARLVDRAGSGSSDDHPPLRTYPAKRYHNQDGDVERSLSGKTRAGFQEDRLDSHEVRRRASGRGVVKRGCHCCNGSPAPPRPKKAKKKPTMDFNSN